MKLQVFESREALGQAAAAEAAAIIREAVAQRNCARIIAATGASQFDFLKALTSTPAIPWDKVEMFHLDEYVGLPMDHPASFRKYLLERLIQPAGLKEYHLLDGEHDVNAVMKQVGAEIARSPVDVAFVGIGENGHLAFNDPPADFDTEEPYIVVQLDEACRKQQLGEGWFPTFDDVPKSAISMSIRQILKARKILCIVPEARKAEPVQAAMEGEISPACPASILRTHDDVTMYLDRESAGRLGSATLKAAEQ